MLRVKQQLGKTVEFESISNVACHLHVTMQKKKMLAAVGQAGLVHSC